MQVLINRVDKQHPRIPLGDYLNNWFTNRNYLQIVQGDIIPSDDDIAAMEEQLRMDGEKYEIVGKTKKN